MSIEQRIERGDALFKLINMLPGEAFGERPACADEDPELFFPASEHATAQIASAKAVCQRCPIQGTCLQVALREGHQYGIWGGLTEGEREQLLRQRRRYWQFAAQVPEIAGDEVAEAAGRALVELERATGAAAPALRRRVADALDRATARGDDVEQRVEAVLVILLADLGVGAGEDGIEGVAA